MFRTLTFLGLLVAIGVGCATTNDAATGASTDELGSCPSGKHECTTWGASCSGDTLNTCVLDENGCGKLLPKKCDLGCSAGACNACETLAAPKRSTSQSTPTAFYRSVSRSGSLAAAGWNERDGIYSKPRWGIAILDVSNPDAVKTLGTLDVPAGQWVLAVHLEGDRLYGIVGDHLQIWDVSNPAAIAPLGAYTIAAAPRSLAVGKGFAYVGSDAGIDVVDVSSAAKPKLAAVYATTVPAYGLALAGSRSRARASRSPGSPGSKSSTSRRRRLRRSSRRRRFTRCPTATPSRRSRSTARSPTSSAPSRRRTRPR